MSRKKGLTRGSSAYQKEADRRNEERELGMKFQTFVGQVREQYLLCTALARIGFTSFSELDGMLAMVRKENALQTLLDAKQDEEFVYAKSLEDRELNEYLPEGMKADWDRCFDFNRLTMGLRFGSIVDVLDDGTVVRENA